jgi:NAD(P)-dependent dehydrogenase (short-subunit alcohol dehydrogenase family)
MYRKETWPMTLSPYSSVLIIGAGSGLSASLARRLTRAGCKVALAARNPAKLKEICEETGSLALACDATVHAQVQDAFDAAAHANGEPDAVIYNASARVRGELTALNPAEVERAISITAFGGFLTGQEAAKRMLPKGRGAILFTGASASVKGYPQSAVFAMGKFALRGLAQSMARELSPRGIHVAHFVIDGAIRNPGRVEPADAPDSMLDPDAIAETYFHVMNQPRSAWTWEVELRPWVERF